jgi:hypothetical protein
MDTGAQIGEVLRGSTEVVAAGAVLAKMEWGHRYVFVHTHPDGRSFSASDVMVLAAHWPLLRAVVAIGAQGTWYVVSVEPGHDAPPPAAVAAAFAKERDAQAPQYETAVRSGDMTRREAQRLLTHGVWEQIAPDLGLRYDRV